MILENCQTGEREAVGKIKILGGGVTGPIFSGGVGVGCSFFLITFLNNLRNWRNANVNLGLLSVQIFIHYCNTVVLSY